MYYIRLSEIVSVHFAQLLSSARVSAAYRVWI